MHEPTFRQALSHSFDLVIHKKSLWIFGLLSAVLGQWGLSDFVGALYHSSNNGFNPIDFQSVAVFFQAFNWYKLSVVLLFLWLLVILLAVLVAVIFVAVSSRGAIIAYAEHWYKNKEVLSLSAAWEKGVSRFSPLFATVVVSRAIEFCLIFLVTIISFNLLKVDSLTRNLLVIVTGMIGMFLALIVESVSIYTSSYLIIDNKKSVLKALNKGIELFKEHLVVSLELGLVLVLFTFLFFGLIVYSSFVAFIPSVLLWLISGYTGWEILMSIGMELGLFLYVSIILVLAGIFNAYVTSAWVYLFMKMHHEGVRSRVLNFLKVFFNR